MDWLGVSVLEGRLPSACQDAKRLWLPLPPGRGGVLGEAALEWPAPCLHFLSGKGKVCQSGEACAELYCRAWGGGWCGVGAADPLTQLPGHRSRLSHTKHLVTCGKGSLTEGQAVLV